MSFWGTTTEREKPTGGFWNTQPNVAPIAPTPVAPKPTFPQLQQQEAASRAKAREANSFWGIARSTIRGVPETVKSMGTGIVKADVGQALGNTQLNRTRAGVMANTVLGLPKAAKETFFPNRGYTDKELGDAKPSFWDTAQGIPKVAVELATFGGDMINKVPGYTGAAQKVTRTSAGTKLADAGARVQDYGIPKTAEEAKAMRFADVASLVTPVGSIKRVGKAADAIRKADTSVPFDGAMPNITSRVDTLDGVEKTYWDANQQKLTVYYDEAQPNEAIKIRVHKALADNRSLDSVKQMTFVSTERGTFKSASPSIPKELEPLAKAPKQVSELDRLIADGKIRVTQRGEYDVFQIKKGQHWMNTRDQYSAIEQVTRQPKPIVAKVEAPHIEELKQKVADAKTQAEIAREVLNDMPGKQLVKYRSSATGALPEVNQKAGQGVFNRSGDTIIQEKLGQEVSRGGDLDVGQQHLDDFIKAQERVKEVKQSYKELTGLLTKAREEAKHVSKEPLLAKPTLQATPALKSMSSGEARSLEILEEQQGTTIPRVPRSLTPLDADVPKQQTPVKKKVNFLDYVRTPDRVLKKIGLADEAKLLRSSHDEYLKELPKNIEKITKWSERVGKLSNERIFKWLDGQAIDLSPNEEQVAKEIRNWLGDWADRLKLPKHKQISHYITHLFDDQLIRKEFDEDLAKIIVDKIPGSVYDPFLEKRLGIQGYKQDTWQALDAYTKRATRKVHMDPVLAKLEDASGTLEESQWKFVKRYADRVNMRPTEADNLLDNFIKSTPVSYRLGQRPVARITQAFRRTVYRAMLGLNPGSAIRNLSQGANVYAKLGEKHTIIGYTKLFSPTARKELMEQGVLSNNFIQDRVMNATQKAWEKVDKGLFSFFDAAEKINRGAAYLGAKSKGLAQGMSEMDAIEYAKKIVRQTQFNYDAVDTPIGMSSDLIKTLTQFSTYPVKQTEFLLGMMKDKEWLGLVRYSASGLAFVYTAGQMLGMEPKELVPIFSFRVLDGGAPSWQLGKEVIGAVINAPDEYGNKRTVGERVKDVSNTVFKTTVPAGTQMKKSYQGYKAVQEGGSYDKSGRRQFMVGGTPAKDAQAYFFGKYASPEAKEYFDKKEEPKVENVLDVAQRERTEYRNKQIRPIYERAQRLKEAGKQAEADALWSALSTEDKAHYKAIKTAEKAKRTRQLEEQLIPLYERLQALKEQGRKDEADAEYFALSPEERHAYDLLKKNLQ